MARKDNFNHCIGSCQYFNRINSFNYNYGINKDANLTSLQNLIVTKNKITHTQKKHKTFMYPPKIAEKESRHIYPSTIYCGQV